MTKMPEAVEEILYVLNRDDIREYPRQTIGQALQYEKEITPHLIAILENEYFIAADTLCDFFGTKKSTVGNKATQIEKACGIGMGAEGFCSPNISDMLTLLELPGGFVIPKSMLSDAEIVHETADEEGAEEIIAYT